MKAVLFVVVVVFFISVVFADDCSSLDKFVNRPILESPPAKHLYRQLDYHEATCGTNCSYINGFSCVTAHEKSVNLSNCNTTAFPLCMGRIEVINGCRTLDCCENLNQEALPKLQKIRGLTSINYYMKFYDGFNNIIPCDEFSSFTEDRCIQFADYGASSDPVTCNALQHIYQSSSSDTMAFDLF